MRREITCLIVDDEEMATKVIEAHLAQIPGFRVAGVYHSAVEAFLTLESQQIDVLFLDIQMPKITGLDLIKMLQHKPLTVLTTAHREFALEGFELEVIDYLMKPIGLNRFLQTTSRLKKLLLPRLADDEVQEALPARPVPAAEPAQHIFIKTNRAYLKIDFAAILHIEAIKNHIKIVTGTETHISLMALSAVEQQLPEQFLRVHRSYIVNQEHIIRFDSSFIRNQAGEIPIGKTYKEQVAETLHRLL